MIAVKGAVNDYAIIKQVQQLKLAFPWMQIVELGETADFSGLGGDERLYLVAHGEATTGELRAIARETLLSWLTSVPQQFGGIVILSCYSGLAIQQQVSLAGYVARGLAGRVATGTPVTGANGYSYGTPEFGRSGYSSVLPMSLGDLNNPGSGVTLAKMNAWLDHTPTHPEGVLKRDLAVVATDKTIRNQLGAAQKASAENVRGYITEFVGKAKLIEELLEDIIKNKITDGGTAAERVSYLVANGANEHVAAWNEAIVQQDELFRNFYLWATPGDAFTVFTVAQADI
jgi:hypothetical protein